MQTNIIQKFKSPTLLTILLYIGLGLLFCLSNNIYIFGIIKPCFYGLYLSLLFLGCNSFYLSLSYFAGMLFNISLNSIIFGLVCCLVGVSVKTIFKNTNKILPIWLSSLLTFILGFAYIFLETTDISVLYLNLISIILNSIFALCCTNFLKVVKTRKYNFNLNIDEVVCGCILLSLFFCGLQNISVFQFDFVKLVGVLFFLFFVKATKSLYCLLLSIVAGLGIGLCAGDLNYIAIFSCITIFALIFKDSNKFFSCLTAILVDFIFCLFFQKGGFDVMCFLPTFFSTLLFYFIPSSIYQKLNNCLLISNDGASLKNILNQNKLHLSKKLLFASEVFYEMDKNFRKLVKGGLDVKNAKLMICNELIKSNCENCAQRAKCLKNFNSELKRIFEQLINTGFEKGKITLVDLPTYLTNRCTKLNQLLAKANSLFLEYKNYCKMMGSLDSSKMLIADQLGGISNILKDLSTQTNQTVNMDYKTEKLIKETLIYNDIVPNEVVCFEQDEKTNVVSLILRSIDIDEQKIADILSKICNRKMKLEEIIPNPNTNLTYVSYCTAPTYDIAVGIAQTSKGGEDMCGDTHSASKLSGDKFMFALCDGMGHGKKANEASDLSISLIENFYKAGFDNQTILTSVNRLLNLGREDVFSALDVSVVDLKNGEIDFIKQGATNGYIKKGENLCKIESNSLPLGILEEAKPKVTKTVLTTDDIVIMLSDGITDAFEKEDNLEDFLKTLPSTNPQDLAERILNRAKRQQKNYPKDDMTVLVGKIFYNFA